MQCERCNQKRVTVHYRENRNGKIRALKLCGDCAEHLERAGELEDMSVPLYGIHTPSFFAEDEIMPLPMSDHPAAIHRGERRCSVCGTEISEIMTAGLVGCSACYESFSSELTAPLGVLHGQAVHRGKVSAGYRNKLERMRRLEELKKQLKAAVSEEEFEQAAALRDEIRELNTALGGR